MVVKYCFIPSCNKSSKYNPKKIFIRMPQNMEIRKRWYGAVYPDMSKVDLSKTSMLFCCEDHFDMEADCVNWMQYKMIGSKLQMKKEAVPHRNIKSNESTVKESQFSSKEKKRKRKLLEALRREKFIFEDTASTSPMSGKRMLPTLSAVPNETVKDEFNTPENIMDEKVNNQFEFVSCDSVSANENDVDSQNKAVLNIKSDIIENFNGVKEEKIEHENCLAQELIQHHFLLSNVEMRSLILTEEQKAEEMLEQSIPIIKDEFIEFEDSADQDIKINTNCNVKDEPDDSLRSSEKQQAQEMLQDDITIKEEYIEFEDRVV